MIRLQDLFTSRKSYSESCEKIDTVSSPSSSDYECKSSTSEISVKAGPSTANLEVPPKRKRGRKNIFDERLSASLDFAKLSDRKATVVLTSTLKSAGTDPSKYNINSSSVRRQRMKQRKRVAESLKKEFQPNTPLTVHWDGKLIEDITGHKTVDRLPILVSGQGVDQLWLSQNSVMELGRRVLQLFMTLLFLGTWATKSNVLLRHHCGQYRFKSRCLHFIRTEDRKDALWLACRHHIMEIVLEAVVVQALGLQVDQKYLSSNDLDLLGLALTSVCGLKQTVDVPGRPLSSGRGSLERRSRACFSLCIRISREK
ncbi:hypothetical protein EVAR_85604_1 [Eumeta japonica]|uniref:Uncharacterized protein n=1 Tax=Eumeta variegata TaxID=151549 RepID=A0A4C1XUI5_EUMVA|nr:hypothetical protein EVAR_85604_1 [Eumeta japonica]